MIRIKIAVALLKWAGALVEYRVKRIRARTPGSSKHVDGSTLYRVKNISLARDRFEKAHCGDGESVSVQIIARVLERHKQNAPLVGNVAIVPPIKAAGAAAVSSEQSDDDAT
jgi:hypothetical protein